MRHSFMAPSIPADDIKYFKHSRAIFGALNELGMKNATESWKAERSSSSQEFAYILGGLKHCRKCRGKLVSEQSQMYITCCANKKEALQMSFPDL